MAQKRAAFLTYGADGGSGELRRWIEEAGVILDVRDIEKQPLAENEIERMIGYLELNHFLNPNVQELSLDRRKRQASAARIGVRSAEPGRRPSCTLLPATDSRDLIDC